MNSNDDYQAGRIRTGKIPATNIANAAAGPLGDPTANKTRVQVIHEGAALVVGDRQQDYGSPQENFQRIADLWNTHLAGNLLQNLSPRQVAEMMVLLKMARTINSPKRDSYVDIVGYAGIAAELAEDEA